MAGWSKGRGAVAAAALAGSLYLVERASLIPAYREITGFAPFDLQKPLSQVMIGIELGAFEERTAIGAYAAFAAVDFVRGAALAAMLTFLWMWMFEKAPTKAFTFLKRGGILMLPSYVVSLDMAAKVGLYRLLQGLNGNALTETIAFCATVHRLQLAVADIRDILAAAFLGVAAAVAVKRLRKSGAADSLRP